MYIIRNKQYEFVKCINNNGIEYTRILSDAIIFNVKDYVKLCKQFIDKYVGYEDFTIYEIDFKEVD